MIPRGTTPTNTFNVDVDLRMADVLFITYSQHGRTILEKTLDDVTVTATQITLQLSQLDTLRFSDDDDIYIQIRARFPNGDAIKSNVVRTNSDALLKVGII